MNLEIGDKVEKAKGYAFEGEVVAIFKNTRGHIRVVAEHYGSQTKESGGMLHIFSDTQLNKVDSIIVLGDVRLSSLVYHRENEGTAKPFRCTKNGYWFFEKELLEKFTKKEIERVTAFR